MKSESRIEYLDGLRGIAILLVLLHHAIGPWNLMFHNEALQPPMGIETSLYPPVAYGYFGVELFFFISGYVIFMTLQKCKSYSEFLYRRWLRLFPAMLICSAIVFLTAHLFKERPMGMPSLSALLPGLTFVDPAWYETIFNRSQPVLEGAFWSLFVEMRFYILFGFVYYFFGRRASVFALVGMFFLGMYIRFLHSVPFLEANEIWKFFANYVDAIYAKLMHWWLSDCLYYGMFSSGVLFYMYTQSRNEALLALSAIFSFVVAVALGCSNFQLNQHAAGVLIAVIVIFAIPISSALPIMQKIYSNRIFVFVGFISYPLYLVHQNIMVSTIIKLRNWYPNLNPLMAIVPSALFVIAIAWLVARFAEPAVGRILRNFFLLLKTRKRIESV